MKESSSTASQLNTRPSGARKQIIRDGIWVVIGEGFAVLGMLAGIRVLTWAAPPAVYAAAILLFGVTTFTRNLFYQPFLQATLRFYPEAARRDVVPTLRRVLLWYMYWATAIIIPIAGAVGLISYIRGDLSLGVLLILLTTLLFDNPRLMEIALLNAARRQKSVAFLRPFDAWCRPLMAIGVIAILGPTDFSILLGYLLAGISGYLLFLGIDRVGCDSNRPASTDNNADISDFRRRIWTFAMPMAPMAIVDWTLVFSDRYILGAIDGLESAGIYAAGCSLATTPFIVAQTAVENWLRPIYFEAVEEGDPARSRKVLAGYIATITGLCLVGVLSLSLFGPWIADMMLDSRYQELGPMLPVIALGSSLYALCQVIEKVFHAHHRMRLCLVSRTAGAIACIAITIPMIAAFGLKGAAWSGPLYFGVQLIATILLTRLVNNPADDRFNGKFAIVKR